MQAGTTGINTIRIYNPVKQGQDQDADGSFIRRWCPELARVPTRWIHMPWTMPLLEQAEADCLIGRCYPLPVVDHVATARHARDRIWGVRRDRGFAAGADAIQARHGSRRSGLPQPAKAAQAQGDPPARSRPLTWPGRARRATCRKRSAPLAARRSHGGGSGHGVGNWCSIARSAVDGRRRDLARG
jgi:hypothetical protein